jgi:predicted phage baseplate assembly protein
LHTELTLNNAVSSTLQSTPGAVKVLHNWVEIGRLVDQPPGPWDGVSSSLQAVPPSQFPNGSSLPILLEDSNAVGADAKGNAAGATLSVIWGPTTATPLSPGLQPPIDVYFNVLPVTRGQTIANEILGTGDAAVPGQSFKLAKSPVTYLTPTTSKITSGPTFASTIQLTVNGLPWKEVPTFYGQPPNAQVFVTREDPQQNTWVDFGDGVNGERPSSGASIVVTYRIGAGADAPPAGKLTVIAQTYPGLQAVVNPVPVSGGSDPDPASLLKQTAPRSVLTFGRAVSVLDYQAIAAGVSGVNRAAANWSWDGANQRAAILIYVAGDPGVANAVNDLLAVEDDPNRPVTVLDAQPQPVTLTMTVTIVAGTDQTALMAALTTALDDPQTGLFSPARMGIGQPLFNSLIEAACVAVPGVIGLQSLQVAVNGVSDSGSLHTPGEGGYFTLQTPFAPSFQAVAQ